MRIYPEDQISNSLDRKNLTTRRPLIPFDQISYPQNANRGRSVLMLNKIIPNLKKIYEKRKNRQERRLQTLSLINDRSYQKIDFTQNLITNFYNTIDAHIETFKPDSKFILIWNLFILFSIFINLIETPLAIFIKQIVYFQQRQIPIFIFLNAIYITGLFLDTFFIRFNLAFYRHDQLIDIRKQIFANYLRLNFWLDSIAWFCMFIYYVSEKSQLVYLKLFFYLRIVTLFKIDNQVQFSISIHKVRYCAYKFIRVLLFMWFLTTWVSSIYFSIDYYYYKQKGYFYNTGQLWLTNSNCINNMNLIEAYPYWYIWYEYAVYWSLQTSAGVGYGNMTPRNPVEVLYCNFIILLNTIFFAYFIRTIWQIIEQLQQSYNKSVDNWIDLKQYLKKQQIPRDINTKVAGYLEQLLINQTQDYNQQEFSSMLSSQLSCELNVIIRGKFFQQIQIFKEMSQFSIQWCQLLKEVVFAVQKQKISSGQELYNFGDTDRSLFYLVRGKVGIYIDSLQIGSQISGDSYFGIQQFVIKRKRLTNALTLTFAIYWKISEEEYKKYLKKYPNLYYKYSQLQERALIYKQSRLCNSKCIKCKVQGHQFIDCPELNSWRKNFVKAGYIHRQIMSYDNNKRQNYIRSKRGIGRINKVKGIYLQKYIQTSHQVFKYKTYRNFYNID